MGRTNTTDSFRKNLKIDIEYLRGHLEIARRMLSEMIGDNVEDVSERDKGPHSLCLGRYNT